MNAPVDVGTEVAALHFYLATAQRLDHDAVAMLAGIVQHRDAALGSATDDAWLWTINKQRNEQIAALAPVLREPQPLATCECAATQVRPAWDGHGRLICEDCHGRIDGMPPAR